MFCIAAFIVLSILGIFSATNRQLAKEALDCVLRRVTFRPCNTGFDKKMKARIVGGLLTRSEPMAKFINKYFEVISWIFVVLLIASLVFGLRGLYLFYVTGSCNGLNNSGFCVFDPKGENNAISTLPANCNPTEQPTSGLTIQGVDLSTFMVFNPEASDPVVFIGCYECEYSRKAYPQMMQLVERYKPNFTFAHYPAKEKTGYLSQIAYCAYQQDPNRFWDLNAVLFAAPITDLQDEAWVKGKLTELGFDPGKLNACLFDPRTATVAQNQVNELNKTGLFGTPTVFIKGEPMVGPKPYRVYAIALKGVFFWLVK